jgi:hypothetical protein
MRRRRNRTRRSKDKACTNLVIGQIDSIMLDK